MPPRGQLPAALLLLAILAPALAGAAAAQAAPLCAVEGAVNPAGLPHQPGEARRYNVTFTATGAAGGTLNVTTPTVPAGWEALVVPSEQALAAGASRTVEVVLRAPREGAGDTAIPVLGRLTCEAPVVGGLEVAASEQVLTPSLLAPGPAAQPPGEGPPVGLLAALALAAAVGAAAMRRRRGPVALTAPHPRRDVPPGGGASFPLVVAHRGKAAAAVELRLGDVPPGWVAVPPPREVPLEPGAETTVHLLLRSPPGAAPGTMAEVAVTATLPGDPRGTQVAVQAFVVPPGEAAPESTSEALPGQAPPRARTPPDPAERPDVVVRDEEALRREDRRRGG